VDVDAVEDLEAAIAWYRDLVPPSDRTRGPLLADADAVATILETIGSELGPLMLSSDLVWFWRTWGGYAIEGLFDLLPYPSLTVPSFALESWQMLQVQQGHPRVLFPVAYESHGFLFAELDTAAEGPAPLWYYTYGDEDFELRYGSLAALFRIAAEILEAHGVQVETGPNRSEQNPEHLDPGRFSDACERSLIAAGLKDRPRRVSWNDERRWPQGWRVANGLSPEDFDAHGRTHTVTQLLEASKIGPTEAYLHGEFRMISGGYNVAGEDLSLYRLADATGTVGVVMPRAMQGLGKPGRESEIHVICQSDIGALPTDPGQSLIAASISNEAEQYERFTESFGAVLNDALPHIPRVIGILHLDS